MTIFDDGNYSETSTLSLYVESALIGTKTFAINAGSSSPIFIVWNSGGQLPGRYSIQARVARVAHEVRPQNNILNSTFRLTFMGDVNRDGKVNVFDLATIGLHFYSVFGGLNYLAAADLNHDAAINIFDITICAHNFGASIS